MSIAVLQELHPELRRFYGYDVNKLREIATIDEERDRFYIISHFECNGACKFCLFRFEQVPMLPDEQFANRIRHILNKYDVNPSISITGGEPLLFPHRLRMIFLALRDYQERLRWIGIGTNANVPIPYNTLLGADWGQINIYISRHSDDFDECSELMGHKPHDLSSMVEQLQVSHIHLAFSCNLIKGYIDSIDRIKDYLRFAQKIGISEVCFRGLNSITPETASYSNHTEYYLRWYKEHVVSFPELLSELDNDKTFKFVSQDIRPSIYHERWNWNGVDVLFRRLSEDNIIEYNQSTDKIDALVLYPNGRLCGCWDPELKVLEYEEGGD